MNRIFIICMICFYINLFSYNIFSISYDNGECSASSTNTDIKRTSKIDKLIGILYQNCGRDMKMFRSLTDEMIKFEGDNVVISLYKVLNCSNYDARRYLYSKIEKADPKFIDSIYKDFKKIYDAYTRLEVIELLGRIGGKNAIEKLNEISNCSTCFPEIRAKAKSVFEELNTSQSTKMKDVRDKTSQDRESRNGVVAFVLDSNFSVSGHGTIAKSIIQKECPGIEVKEIQLKKNRYTDSINRKDYLRRLLSVLEYSKRHRNMGIILNLSFGGYGYDNLEHAIIKALSDNGVVIVAACGNDNRRGVVYPAAFEEVIAVASTTLHSKKKTEFSNWGKGVDICAPSYTTYMTGHSYKISEGTSFSSPIIAGIIAEMLRTFPRLPAYRAVSIIEGTADSIDDRYFHKGYLGVGLANKTRAIKEASSLFDRTSMAKWKYLLRFKKTLLLFGLISIIIIIVIIFYRPYLKTAEIYFTISDKVKKRIFLIRRKMKLKYLNKCMELERIEEYIDDIDYVVKNYARNLRSEIIVPQLDMCEDLECIEEYIEDFDTVVRSHAIELRSDIIVTELDMCEDLECIEEYIEDFDTVVRERAIELRRKILIPKLDMCENLDCLQDYTDDIDYFVKNCARNLRKEIILLQLNICEDLECIEEYTEDFDIIVRERAIELRREKIISYMKQSSDLSSIEVYIADPDSYIKNYAMEIRRGLIIPFLCLYQDPIDLEKYLCDLDECIREHASVLIADELPETISMVLKFLENIYENVREVAEYYLKQHANIIVDMYPRFNLWIESGIAEKEIELLISKTNVSVMDVFNYFIYCDESCRYYKKQTYKNAINLISKAIKLIPEYPLARLIRDVVSIEDMVLRNNSIPLTKAIKIKNIDPSNRFLTFWSLLIKMKNDPGIEDEQFQSVYRLLNIKHYAYTIVNAIRALN